MVAHPSMSTTGLHSLSGRPPPRGRARSMASEQGPSPHSRTLGRSGREPTQGAPGTSEQLLPLDGRKRHEQERVEDGEETDRRAGDSGQPQYSAMRVGEDIQRAARAPEEPGEGAGDEDGESQGSYGTECPAGERISQATVRHRQHEHPLNYH